MISRVIENLQKLEDVVDAEEKVDIDLTGKLWLFISTQDDKLCVSPLQHQEYHCEPWRREDWKIFPIEHPFIILAKQRLIYLLYTSRPLF